MQGIIALSIALPESASLLMLGASLFVLARAVRRLTTSTAS